MPSANSKALDRQEGGDHYKQMPIQPVQFAHYNKLSFLEGCVVKRVTRHNRGGKGVEDLRKAIHELELLIELEYGEYQGAPPFAKRDWTPR